jgi:hypothetical protein
MMRERPFGKYLTSTISLFRDLEQKKKHLKNSDGIRRLVLPHKKINVINLICVMRCLNCCYWLLWVWTVFFFNYLFYYLFFCFECGRPESFSVFSFFFLSYINENEYSKSRPYLPLAWIAPVFFPFLFLVQRLVLISIFPADLRPELEHCLSVNLFTITEWIFLCVRYAIWTRKFHRPKNPCRGELIQSINCFSVSFRRSHNWVPIKSSRQTKKFKEK